MGRYTNLASFPFSPFLLVRHCNYRYLVPFASYFTLNNIFVTLKSGLEVTQGH